MKLVAFIKYLWNRFIRNLTQHSASKKNAHYRSLTPSDGADPDEAYQRALISALDNPDVKNIAITGGYGSGKSSVIKTFFKKHPDWQPVFISLAIFGTTKTDRLSEDLQPIEKSILQQLFYTVPQSDIPLSRFKRITEPNGYAIFKYVVFISILFFSVWCHLNGGSPNLQIPYDQKKLLISMHPAYSFLNILILISYPIVLLVALIKQGLSLSELKMRIHDAEIAISSTQTSVLNDHIDEILYFFQKKKVKAVVIEDLDRFESPEIFTRLRELNSLLNFNSDIGGCVRFIYAVRDDLFVDKDRTKFFDFIVPIIPIVNPTNAYDLIKADYSHVKGINDVFLRQVSLYFDDLRLMRNIFNEFQLYLDKQKNLSLDPNKLLALIIYKNYYPEDFSKLHCNQGEIYSIFNFWKQEQIRELARSMDDALKHLVNEREKSILEIERNTVVIDRLYAAEIAKRAIEQFSNQPLLIKVNDAGHSIVELLSGSLTNSLYEAKNFSFTQQNYYGHDLLKLSFSEIEKSVDPATSYSERIQSINLKGEDQRKKLDNEIARLNESIAAISKSTVKKLFLENSDLILPGKLVGVLSYLVKEGYLEEGYAEYISLFIPSLISLVEKNFILRVNARDKPDFEISLTKIQPMLDHYLSIRDFSYHTVLNFSLMDFFLKNSSHFGYRKEFFSLLADESTISITFVKNYIERNINVAQFIALLPDYWEGWLHYFLINESDRVLEHSLRHISKGNLTSNKKQTEALKDYLSSKIDPISFLQRAFLNNGERIIDFVSDLRPKFERLDCPENALHLFSSFGQAGHFQINPHNIISIINKTRPEDRPLDSLGHSPFSLINSKNIEYLSNQLFENADTAIMIFASAAPLVEPENIVAVLFNRCTNQDLKRQLLSNWTSKFSDINIIDDEACWGEIFSVDKILPYWENVICFSESGSMDMDILTYYLNRRENYEQMSFFAGSEKNIPEEHWDKLWTRLITCNQLSDIAYHHLLSFCEFVWESISLEDLSNGKVSSLLESGRLLFTDSIVGEIKSNHASLLSSYYQSVIEHIVDAAEDKFNILSATDFEVIVSGEIQQEDKRRILLRLDASKIEESIFLQAEILAWLVDLQLSAEVFDLLFDSRARMSEKKVMVLNQLKYFSVDRISSVLDKIQDGFEGLFQNMRTKTVVYSEENIRIAQALFQRGLCSEPIITSSKSARGKSKINIRPLAKVALT
jgi:hypothetical protein